MAKNDRRLIDANQLPKHRLEIKDIDRPEPYIFDVVFLADLETAETVDAVEVVRCKDCEHWKPSGSWGGNSVEDMQPLGGCKWSNGCRRGNDFCSTGKRKAAGHAEN